MATRRSDTYGGAIRSLKVGAFVTLKNRLEHGGSLQARKLANGSVQFYWRYSHEGKTSREPIGLYDSSAPPKKLGPTANGYGVLAALEKCKALAEIHAQRANTGGLREARQDERKEFSARKAAEVERSERTLAKLLDAYVAHLRAQGRRSYKDADGLFRVHVKEAWPEVANTPAADITPDQILDMLRRLVEHGKGRSANKLRSYLRAAYQCAIDVRTTASTPVAFKAFEVAFNPAAQTRRDPKFDRADKHPLSANELRAYWRLLKSLPGLQGAALRLHLLTGGQRVEQFVRLRRRNVAVDSITIFDAKGRPGQGPRPHVLPLLDQALPEFAELNPDGEFVMSTTEGAKPISAITLLGWAHDAVGDAIVDFQLKRIRSGIETLLAANGISREVRGHLQSHGLTGVQARHYDGHDYMPEKRRALELLLSELERRDTKKVVQMKRNRA